MACNMLDSSLYRNSFSTPVMREIFDDKSIMQNILDIEAALAAADAELEEQINDRIQQDNGIRDYLARAAQLISGGSLKTEWTGGIAEGDLFICTVSAEGALETTRPTQVLTASNIDLRDGHEIGLGELFTDEAAAREMIESYLEDEVAPELSAHLEAGELLPLPEKFWLESTGLSLLYPVGRLSTLSGRAAS